MLSLLRPKLILILTLLEIHFSAELTILLLEILPSEILRVATWLSLFKGSTSIAKMPLVVNFVLLTKMSGAFNSNKEPEKSSIVTLFNSNDISLPSNDTIPFSLLVALLPLTDTLSVSGSTIRFNSWLSQKLNVCGISGCILLPLFIVKVEFVFSKQTKVLNERGLSDFNIVSLFLPIFTKSGQ